MALITFPHEYIEVDVSDRVYGGTIFKQRARFVHMSITQDDGIVEVIVKLKVSLHANDGGAYGPEIFGKGVMPYNVMLRADNDAAVNAATGQVLYERGALSPEQFEMRLSDPEQVPETVMYQGDFFERIMHHAPVEIAPMVRNFMLQADQAPYFKFS